LDLPGAFSLAASTKPPRARVSGALTSRLGRRFVLLFAGCALLPLIIYATLSVTRVSDQVRIDTNASLHAAAKSSGMGVAARLDQVANDLVLASDLVQSRRLEGSWSGEALQGQVSRHCAGVWLVEGDRVERLCGDLKLPKLAKTQADLAHLAAGKKLLQVVGNPAQLMMSFDVDVDDDDDDESAHVVALINGDWFWDPQELRGTSCDFACCDPDGRVLFDTWGNLPAVQVLAAGVTAGGSSGPIDWTIDGEPQIGRFWLAFLQPQYNLDLWMIQSRSKAGAFKVDREFVQFFWLTAIGTMLCVVLGSLVQMRRTLDPIVALSDATQRLGRGELDVRVWIESRDEFGDLGAAFNDMAQRLQDNITQRERTEQELVMSRDAALAAVQAKAEFVTNVSHEFRTPMAEILGATEILTQIEEDDDASVREEFSGIALHGAQRMARLLDDVLELGQVTTGMKSLIDVPASIANAVAGMQPELRERVTCDIDSDLPQVLCETNRLNETWCRLLDNAGKFSDPGTPIEVRVVRAGSRILVDVTDHGVGIAAGDLEKVFEPFSQVGRDQMVNKAHGTGLGLTLARSTIESCGGVISVRSEIGRGSTFRISLPVANVAAESVAHS
jgi:signal transduction histidine kinase